MPGRGSGCPLVTLLVLAACGCGTESDNAIRVEPVVELGDLSGEGALASYPHISARFPGGHYFVTEPWGYSPALVRVFDSLGRYERSVGRFGDGPDEYRGPEFVRRVGDSAYIFDTQARRLTVLAEHDSAGRSQPWTRRPHTFLALGDGTFVLSTGSWGPGRTLEHLSRQGELLDRFGDSVTPEALRFKLGYFADAIDSGFWSARGEGRLEFQFWNAPGESGRAIRLERDWYPEYTSPRSPTPDIPPPASLIGFWLDSAGALWLVANVADPEWPEGLDSARPGEGGLQYHPMRDLQLVFDGVVERVDLESGQTLLHRRFDELFIQVVEPWIVATSAESEDGWHQVTLWRVSAPGDGE